MVLLGQGCVGLEEQKTSAPLATGIVTASEPEAALAGAAILAAGGNAIDAAVAAALALGVVEPQSSGIGGGSFTLIHLAASGETLVIDGRETAPAAATPLLFGAAHFDVASTSGRAVGVPHALLAMETLLSRWGTRSLADVLQPAIALAADGFVVGTRLAASLREGLATGGRLAHGAGEPAYEAARHVFAPNGVPLAAGDRLLQPQLAATLRHLAQRGTAAFYDCADEAGIARALVASQRAHRPGWPQLAGTLTCEDLAASARRGPVIRQPLIGRYRQVTVKTMPPPSSGGLCLLQMLAMLERFPLADEAAGFGFGAAATLTVMQEAMRLSFADRALWMGDADADPALPVAALLDGDYLRRRSATCPDPDPTDAEYCLRPDRRLATVHAGDPRPLAGGPPAAAADGGDASLETTHLTVADRWGNVVSYTATIESLWGSGLMVAGHGFLLNNQLTDFNLRPRARRDPFDPGANDAAPGKRPRSSMAPTMLFAPAAGGGERLLAAYGSPGGASIINTVLAITLNLVDHRLPVAAAIDAPRLSLTSAEDDAATAIEEGFAPAVLAELAARGYRFGAPAPIGSVQAVTFDPDTGTAHGGADRRRRGTVIVVPPPSAPPVPPARSAGGVVANAYASAYSP